MDGDVENSGLRVSQGFGDLPSAAGHRAMTRRETGGDRSRCVSMTILCLFLLAAGIMVLVLAVSGGDDSGNPRTAPLPAPSISMAPVPSNVFEETGAPVMAPSTVAPVVTETPTLSQTTFQPTTALPTTSQPTTFEESNFTLAPTEEPTYTNTTSPTQSPSSLNTTSPTLQLNETLNANETASPSTDLFNSTSLAPTMAPQSDSNVTDDFTGSENSTSFSPTLSPLGVKTIVPGLNITEDDGEETSNPSPDTSPGPTAPPTLPLNGTDPSL